MDQATLTETAQARHLLGRRSGGRLARHKARTGLLMLAPALAFFALLYFYPLGIELWTSLYSGPHADTFEGLGNYQQAVVADPAARHAFWVTIRYATGVLIISIVLGLLLATILNRARISLVFRGALLIPYLTSVAIVGLLWRNILDPHVGILNRLLRAVGLPEQTWLSTQPVWTIIGIGAWQDLGYATTLFLAGLHGIPDVYYEAARVDGAAPLQRFRYITLPLLAPTTLFVCVVGVITGLQQFALPFIVTDGGPSNATDLFVYHMYQTAFTFGDFGYSSALAYLLLIVILILSVIQLRLGRRDVSE